MALADELDGYCTTVIREAALTAMRESLDATEVTAAYLATVRTSPDPVQLAKLEAYAAGRA